MEPFDANHVEYDSAIQLVRTTFGTLDQRQTWLKYYAICSDTSIQALRMAARSVDQHLEPTPDLTQDVLNKILDDVLSAKASLDDDSTLPDLPPI